MLSQKRCFGIVLAALLILSVASTSSIAGARVYVSYSSGRTVSACSPVTTYYVSRPTVIYAAPPRSCVTVCQTNYRPVYNEGFSISYSSGSRGHHSYPQRYYYNQPSSHRYGHRQQLYHSRRW